MAVAKSSVTIPVRAEVCDGFVGLDWGESAPPNFGTTAPTMWPMRSKATTASPNGHRNGECYSCREPRSPTNAPCSRSPIPTSGPNAPLSSALLDHVGSAGIDVR